MFPIAGLFAALYACAFCALSVNVIIHRRKSKAGIGNPNHDAMLERKIRAHGNFAEYTPLMLVMLLLLEASKFIWLMECLGMLYLLARASHAYGLLVAEPERKDFRFRVAGMATTFSCYGFAAVALVYRFFAG